MASGKVKPWETSWGNWDEEGSPYAVHSVKLQPKVPSWPAVHRELAGSPPAMWFMNLASAAGPLTESQATSYSSGSPQLWALTSGQTFALASQFFDNHSLSTASTPPLTLFLLSFQTQPFLPFS